MKVSGSELNLVDTFEGQSLKFPVIFRIIGNDKEEKTNTIIC